jgi:hypothetical protein
MAGALAAALAAALLVLPGRGIAHERLVKLGSTDTARHRAHSLPAPGRGFRCLCSLR